MANHARTKEAKRSEQKRDFFASSGTRSGVLRSVHPLLAAPGRFAVLCL
jgi:hypothetical protein